MENTNTTKIKVKIGDFEFEADGPPDLVREQFASFKEMISAAPKQVAPATPVTHEETPDKSPPSTAFPHLSIQKIMHVSGRVVSLTALPASTEDAALLIMLGHKDLRDNLAVTGQEIGDGLGQSGRPVARVDRLMEKALKDAFVLKTGIKRATRYRLTNQGLHKSLGIAKDLLATLP